MRDVEEKYSSSVAKEAKPYTFECLVSDSTPLWFILLILCPLTNAIHMYYGATSVAYIGFFP